MGKISISGFVVSALKGGAGKTVLSLGLIACLKKKFKKKVSSFKKGPDYIDTSWLALATGQPCYNLDTFLIKKDIIKNSFYQNSLSSDISIIEGNRGLFDGIDIYGTTSTAELAKLLDLPVILCLDCTKVTRTIVTSVIGCTHFDPNLKIEGIILNQIAGARHGKKIRDNLEAYTDIKVLGIVPRLIDQKFPERHMGLVPTYEHTQAQSAINIAYNLVKDNVNIDEIIKIAEDTKKEISIEKQEPQKIFFEKKVKIGVCRDAVFQFYYEENLSELKKNGAELIFLSPLSDKKIPDLDAIYIGGGFPETNAENLSKNTEFKNALKNLIERGLPVYAECGGLLYLSKSITVDKKDYSMADIFPLNFSFAKKPQGHGYTIIKAEKDSPFFQKGSEIKGHEFRYSKISKITKNINMAFSVKRGIGIKNSKDGLCYKNTFATYTHIHALGTPIWTKEFIKKAVEYSKMK